MNVPSIVMFAAGVVFIYSAVKNKDPRDVVRMALNQPSKYGALAQEGIGQAPPQEGTTAPPAARVPFSPPAGTVWTSI